MFHSIVSINTFSVSIPLLSDVWYMPKSDIAGSSGRTISKFQRNCQTYFQSGFNRLQSHKKWRSVPLCSHPHQHLLSLEFFILAILTGVRWNLKFILIYISLMSKDVEHFCKCFRAITIPQSRIICLAVFFILNRTIWFSAVYLHESFE